MLEDFDPSTIEDEGLRQIVMYLMNMVENLSAKVAEQAEEIQRLRDENNRLKGEQGKPRVLPNKGRANLSSEKERRKSKPHHKANKQAHIQIDREVVVPVPQREILLAQPKADVSGPVASRLPRPVWAGGESLGLGPVLRKQDE